MNFLLIANNDIDGVGQPAVNLCKNLSIKGHQSRLIVLHKFSKKKFVKKIKRSIFARILLFFLNLLKKKYSELFGFGYSTVKFEELKRYLDKADVVIIYTLHKIISNVTLEKILKTKKIVYFRPLDIELASGGCHFNEECSKFKSTCKRCPKLYYNNLIDIPFKNQSVKKKIFEKYKPTIFTQNHFVKNVFKQSSIFKNLNLIPVYLGANINRNKKYLKSYARKKLNLDNKEKIILFGAFNLNSHIKGGHLLLKSLKLLESRVSENYKNLRLITIGAKNGFKLDSKIIKWTHLDIISSDKKLNLIYRSSDVLVCPSLYDFGPHIVTEALLNDLPVVAYNQGIAHDTVFQGKNGFLINSYDIKNFSEAIYKVLFNKKKKIKNHLQNKMKKICSSEYEVNKIIDISQKDFIKSTR